MGLLLAFLFAIQLEAPLRAKLDPFRRGPAWAMNRVIGAGFLHILKTWSPWAFRQAAPLFPLLWLDVLWSESAVRLLGLGPGPQYDSLGLLLNEELPRLSSDPTLLGFAGFAALLGLAWSTSMESRTPIENPIS
jgi:hypothetical protein